MTTHIRIINGDDSNPAQQLRVKFWPNGVAHAREPDRALKRGQALDLWFSSVGVFEITEEQADPAP